MGQDSHHGPPGMYPPLPSSSPPPSAPELPLGHIYPPPPQIDPPQASVHVYPPPPPPPHLYPNVSAPLYSYPPPVQAYPPAPPQAHSYPLPHPPPGHGYPHGPYVVPPPVAYPSKNGHQDSQQALPPRKEKHKKRGDGFWRGFCAGMCCCCCLDICC
ncbi:hypothetical protein BT93_E1381 [Corymbia citriodora subsp. variegata]|nr:hypothetical protein BT93_E1381 [Corymbia citriodora subsp. variegata]